MQTLSWDTVVVLLACSGSDVPLGTPLLLGGTTAPPSVSMRQVAGAGSVFQVPAGRCAGPGPVGRIQVLFERLPFLLARSLLRSFHAGQGGRHGGRPLTHMHPDTPALLMTDSSLLPWFLVCCPNKYVSLGFEPCLSHFFPCLQLFEPGCNNINKNRVFKTHSFFWLLEFHALERTNRLGAKTLT